MASNSPPLHLTVRSHFFNDSYKFTVQSFCLIKDIKTSVINSFYGQSSTAGNAADKLLTYHRLLAPNISSRSSTNHILRDNLTVAQAQLQDGGIDLTLQSIQTQRDELYLLRSLPPISPVSKPKTPKQLEIDELQDHLLEKEIKKEMKKAGIELDRKCDFITALDAQEFQAPEFFSDMRRIVTIYLEIVFITLCTLSHHAEIDPILTKIRDYFIMTLYPVELNPAYVIEFREMGYSATRTKYAFFLNKNRTNDALDWLKQNKSMLSVNIPDLYQNEIEKGRNHVLSTPINDVGIMLELFQQYRQYTFKADMFALNNLKEMGFGQTAIVDALKQGENSYPASIRILSGDKSPSLLDMTYLTYPNRLYQSMMERLLRNHILDTKVIMALLAFYREPEKIIFGWCWNREIAPIIFEMFETYNLEIQDLYHCDCKYGSIKKNK